VKARFDLRGAEAGAWTLRIDVARADFKYETQFHGGGCAPGPAFARKSRTPDDPEQASDTVVREHLQHREHGRFRGASLVGGLPESATLRPDFAVTGYNGETVSQDLDLGIPLDGGKAYQY
jgi:hypothetical protein